MTKSYVFAGKVLPERESTGITIIDFETTAKEEESGLTFNVKVSIIKSQILAAVSTETADILTLRNYVDQVIRILLDSINYLRGYGLDIEITSVTDENNVHMVFGVDITRFAYKEQDIDADFHRLVGLASKSPHLRLALSNLRDAIRRPSDTGFHSYRAIECIRQAFGESDNGEETKKEKEVSWKKMNDYLQIEGAFSKHLTSYANPQRHGWYKAMTQDERIDVMERARKIVDRFCIYLERNEQQLNEREFPKLKE